MLAFLSTNKQSSGEISEAEATSRCVTGDQHAFEALYRLHKCRVYSLCLRMVNNVEEAEDLTQEAFMQLFRKIATFRGESALSTWLHRLTVNVVLAHLRKKGLNEASLEGMSKDEAEDPPEKEYGKQDLHLIETVDRVTLEKSIAELPSGYRTILILHDVEGYGHGEIAEMMDCSVGNSKSQLHKARMKLRDVLRSKKNRFGSRPSGTRSLARPTESKTRHEYQRLH